MKRKKIKKKAKGLTWWKGKAWQAISIFVRSLNAKGEYQQCYTCLGWFKWKTQMDCGHYIHGRLDYELNNLKPQCKRCNKWLRGNIGVYGERLIKEIGPEEVEKMRLYSFKKGNNYTITECKEVIKTYHS